MKCYFKIKKVLFVLIFSLLTLGCSVSEDSNAYSEAQARKEAIKYIKNQLELYPDNNLKSLEKQYGKPAWEYVYTRGFVTNMKLVIPLEQKGVINNIIVYSLYEAEGEYIPYEVVNEESIKNSKVPKKYFDSNMFCFIHEKNGRVNKKAMEAAVEGLKSGRFATTGHTRTQKTTR